MSFRHGVSISEEATAFTPPVLSESSLPVYIGTAPLQKLIDGKKQVNKAVILYNMAEAVEKLGYSDDWEKYTLSEAVYVHFSLYNVAPIVCIAVNDPFENSQIEAAQAIPLSRGRASLSDPNIILSSVSVSYNDGSNPPVLCERGRDYELFYNGDFLCIDTNIEGSIIPIGATDILVEYETVSNQLVTAADIIGGVDSNGKRSGLELIDEIFPRLRLTPASIVVPGWSEDAEVAKVMTAKARNINGIFKAIAIKDLPADSTHSNYSSLPAWKEENNYVEAYDANCWPRAQVNGKVCHMSTHLAALIARTDAENGDIPYASPSNRNMSITGLCLDDGTEVVLGQDQANYLNGQGIITALNWIGGWRAWGNRTGIYPSSSDPKDCFLPIRRMFNWIANSIVLTYWSRVDLPIKPRLIDDIVTGVNIWLQGLASDQAILGGRIVFNESENPATSLMDGRIKFHLYFTPPSPAEEIAFVLEYDAGYLETLFS